MEKEIKTNKEREENNIRMIQEKHAMTLAETTKNYTFDKKNLEDKLESLKKKMQENEGAAQREIADLTKAKAIIDEKLEHLDKKLAFT